MCKTTSLIWQNLTTHLHVTLSDVLPVCVQDRKTALYWAVEKGHAEIVRLLLDNDADMEICTKVHQMLIEARC